MEPGTEWNCWERKRQKAEDDFTKRTKRLFSVFLFFCFFVFLFFSCCPVCRLSAGPGPWVPLPEVYTIATTPMTDTLILIQILMTLTPCDCDSDSCHHWHSLWSWHMALHGTAPQPDLLGSSSRKCRWSSEGDSDAGQVWGARLTLWSLLLNDTTNVSFH
jgi:hypothetical protein